MEILHDGKRNKMIAINHMSKKALVELVTMSYIYFYTPCVVVTALVEFVL